VVRDAPLVAASIAEQLSTSTRTSSVSMVRFVIPRTRATFSIRARCAREPETAVKLREEVRQICLTELAQAQCTDRANACTQDDLREQAAVDEDLEP
jgi:hypothetical protein